MDGAGAAHLTARLRAAGLRATAARRAVLAALADLGGHSTADEVFVAARADGRPIARASVFNALRDLVAAGVALPVDVPGAARYELAGDEHHHFVCRRCGEIRDVPGEAVEVADARRLAAELPGARVDGATVVFRGVCASCASGAGVTPPRPHDPDRA